MPINQDDDDDEIVKDGESVSVPFYLRDGESLPQLRERIAQAKTKTLDAYQQLMADRDAQWQKRFADLQAIIDGTGTPEFGAALMRRQQAWDQRGQRQSQAWRQPRPAAPSEATPRLQHDASLKDTVAARDTAWEKRGQILSNAWRR